MSSSPLIVFRLEGIYCPVADVYIDPWRPVDTAIITHAHADHARWGMKMYIAHQDSIPVMRQRLGWDIKAIPKTYGQRFSKNGVTFSLHPAGHILGSAQVRVAYRGEVWCISGDYKTGHEDSTCVPFEPVKCHHFVTESTFGLPVYQWPAQAQTAQEINQWWSANKSEGVTSVILTYALGKAQRVLSMLDPSIGRIYTHGAVENVNQLFRQHGHQVPDTFRVTKHIEKSEYKGHMIIATPASANTPWMKKFKPYRIAMASGWMLLRGTRRRRNVDKGFVISDHADWNGLNQAIAATGAENIYVTHGYSEIFSQWLQSQGYNAKVVKTAYEGETEEPEQTMSVDH